LHVKPLSDTKEWIDKEIEELKKNFPEKYNFELGTAAHTDCVREVAKKFPKFSKEKKKEKLDKKDLKVLFNQNRNVKVQTLLDKNLVPAPLIQYINIEDEESEPLIVLMNCN